MSVTLRSTRCNYGGIRVLDTDAFIFQLVDLLAMRSESTYENVLTVEQAQFAREHDAVPGMRAVEDDRMVFFYRDGLWATHRWLVNESGRVLASTSFRRVSTRSV